MLKTFEIRYKIAIDHWFDKKGNFHSHNQQAA